MSEGLRGAAQGAGIIRSGLSAAVLGPKEIYAFFAHGTRYHFLRYPVILVAVVQLYHVLKAALTQGIIAGVLGLVIMAISVGVGTLIANLVEKLGWWCAWYPGLGYRLKDGTFKPMLGGATLGKPAKADSRPTPPFVLPEGMGAAKAGERHVRGAALVDGDWLAAQLTQDIDPSTLDKLMRFGGVPIRYKAEAQHFLIGGSTGAGKTQAINSMLLVMRKRMQPAIIADPGAGFYSTFGRRGEKLLNPLDKRSIGWSVFRDIRAPYDCQMIAKAVIPDIEGEGNEWNGYGQTMFAAILQKLWETDEHSTHRLLYLMNVAPAKELESILANTPAYQLTQKGGEKMLNNVRFIVNNKLTAWAYLPDKGTFSIRDWVRQAETTKDFLFLTYRDDQMPILRNLVACWLDLAIVEGLTLSINPERRLWYVMDEVDSLGKVSNLRAALTKLRKYGGVCVAGLQSISQLRTTYGRDEAQTLLSNMSHKVVFRTGDNETAKYFESEIGEQEVIRPESSSSTSTRVGELASNSQNSSERTVQQMAVLASEIMFLNDMHGYLKTIGFPIARILTSYAAGPENNKDFEDVYKTGGQA